MNPKWIIGKTVASVDLGAHYDESGTMHAPRITFTDGSSIRFVTEESYAGDHYGTCICYSKPRRKPSGGCATCGHSRADHRGECWHISADTTGTKLCECHGYKVQQR